LIETSVQAEYQTFLRNKNSQVAYAHVDSVNIFRFIEDILAKPRNNPTHSFQKFSEIEHWLRDQWAGLFRELLNRRSDQLQLAALATQVNELKETNKTLKHYLEAVMSHSMEKGVSDRLIKTENERLSEAALHQELERNSFLDFVKYAANAKPLDIERILSIAKNAKSFDEFARDITAVADLHGRDSAVKGAIRGELISINALRVLLGAEPFPISNDPQ
jgi:hypothetical protein